MRIATWNVERPRSQKSPRCAKIVEFLKEIHADILVLTETATFISPGPDHSGYSTSPLIGSRSLRGETYGDGENRATIWTKYRAKKRHETSDPSSSVCVELETPVGELIVYGTVIGALGNRHVSFATDLQTQVADWKRLASLGTLCIVGDYNLSFGDSYYFTKQGRLMVEDCFRDLRIGIPTRDIRENIDHIALSETLFENLQSEPCEWPKDRALSDHKPIALTLEADPHKAPLLCARSERED